MFSLATNQNYRFIYYLFEKLKNSFRIQSMHLLKAFVFIQIILFEILYDTDFLFLLDYISI